MEYKGRIVLSGNRAALSIINNAIVAGINWKVQNFDTMSRWNRLKYIRKNPFNSYWLGIGRKVYEGIGPDLVNHVNPIFDIDKKTLSIHISHTDKKKYMNLINDSKNWSNINKLSVKCKIYHDKTD